ncbi:MAG: DUF6375 family protein [Pseudomonadota bacterium]
MKIWQSYGAEHSMNLVIIGRFKEVIDAEEFESLIDSLINFLHEHSDFDVDSDRFGREISDYLSKKNLYCLSPQQLGQLLYDMHLEREGNEIRISSDDDLNAFISLLIHKGAKVEAFSAHDYPIDENKDN